MDTLGLPRSYFYGRIAAAMREVVERNQPFLDESRSEEQQPEMMKVNLQEAIQRLQHCPVCGQSLQVYPNYPLERSCICGDFTMVSVWEDGDVTFEFKMASPEKVTETAEAVEVLESESNAG